MVKSQKDFVALVDLPVGEHHFKYYVDHEWTYDKTLPTVSNEVGSQNNVITIQQEDFEAFAALDMDSATTNTKHKRGPDPEFGQEIPAMSSFESKPGPPILPPHLLQVILNKDTPLSCEPTLLPEPNHVMINHLYALSIKDGVMVISSTQRFRKKYVTTLLYKPIEA
jgi:5'-AMP-activated protein kinase regulatory beta subunit